MTASHATNLRHLCVLDRLDDRSMNCGKCDLCLAAAALDEQAIKIERLREELYDYEDAKKFVLDPPHDEAHCGCVQLLNHELVRVRNAAQDYIKAHKLMRVRFQDAADARVYTEAEKTLEQCLTPIPTPAQGDRHG